MTDTTPEAVARLATQLNREGSWHHFDGVGLDEGADPAPHQAAAMLTALSTESNLQNAQIATLTSENTELAKEAEHWRKDSAALMAANETLTSERDEASAEAEETRRMLHDLLAVIHRDGGQKTDEIGRTLAWEQAMRISSERIAKITDMQAKLDGVVAFNCGNPSTE